MAVINMGATWLLPRLVGVARAKQLLLLGERVDGAQAAGAGDAVQSGSEPPEIGDRRVAFFDQFIGLLRTGRIARGLHLFAHLIEKRFAALPHALFDLLKFPGVEHIGSSMDDEPVRCKGRARAQVESRRDALIINAIETESIDE